MHGARSVLRAKGTTLLELLVAIVFLAVCVVPMLSLVAGSQQRGNDAASRVVAMSLAQDEIEKQRSNAHTTRPTIGTVTSIRANIPGLKSSAQVKVTTRTVQGVANTYEIAVEVTYDDTGSKVSLSTWVKSV